MGLTFGPQWLQEQRYEILRRIGSGGMQDVFLARDHLLERDVALKTPKNRHAVKRFEHTAILSARINHPNVAKTLDYFVEQGTQFLVEEYVHGGDLEGFAAQFSAIDPFIIAQIFHSLARGIRAAHETSVVHRDVKPSNVLVAIEDARIKPKYTDFGIAKLAEEEMQEAVAVGKSTTSTTFLGAIPYMSPEMLRSPKAATTASDIWSLGAMVYELLSGELPFGGPLEALDKIRDGTPLTRPLRIKNNAQMQPLADAIYEIVERCMERDPAMRPSDEDLCKLCGDLCYPIAQRFTGDVVRRKPTSGHGYGFIRRDDGDSIFFHDDCVYGPHVRIGDRVWFASYDGDPRPRALPVVKMNQTK